LDEQIQDLIAPIFIGGAGRSGTTLLRVILDSHPNIVCGPELKVTPLVAQMWDHFQTALSPTMREYYLSPADINKIFGKMMVSLLENYRQRSGKRRIAEKSPNNVFHFYHLSNIFPGSPLIHIIRDGRDVVCSLLTMDWMDPTNGRPLDYTRDIGKAVHYWVSAVQAAHVARKFPSVSANYIELRYEDLVESPEATLRQLFAFLEEPWDPGVLNYHQQKRNLVGESSAAQVSKPLYKSAVGRWKRDLKSGDKEVVKKLAGNLLVELGYAKDFGW
jgi:hypothetical protein